ICESVWMCLWHWRGISAGGKMWKARAEGMREERAMVWQLLEVDMIWPFYFRFQISDWMRAAVAGRLGLVFQLQTAHVCLIWLRKLPAGTEYEVLSTECAAGTTRDFVLRGAWFPVSECHGGHSLQVNTRSLPNAHCFSGQKPGDKNGRFCKKSRKKLRRVARGWGLGSREGPRLVGEGRLGVGGVLAAGALACASGLCW